MNRAATPVKKTVPMCCVTIGYHEYLMPADKGMKVVELMQAAFFTQKDYEDRGYVYRVGEQPNVEFSLVRPNQIKPSASNTNAAGQLLIGRD